jgi:hypothetical protein
MARKKQKRNVTGLRNQPKKTHETLSNTEDEDEGWNTRMRFESLRPCWEMDSDGSENENEDEQYLEEDWSGFHVAGLQEKMMIFAINCGDDPRDEDWVPRRKMEKKGSVFQSPSE